jgi:hypothetical protein
MTETLTLSDRFSGGELETDEREAYLRLRALIQKETDVLEVLGLSWVYSENRWLYWIKTPFASWPKHVVGWTDAENLETEIIFRCGHEAGAREAYNEQNLGEHQ